VPRRQKPIVTGGQVFDGFFAKAIKDVNLREDAEDVIQLAPVTKARRPPDAGTCFEHAHGRLIEVAINSNRSVVFVARAMYRIDRSAERKRQSCCHLPFDTVIGRSFAELGRTHGRHTPTEPTALTAVILNGSDANPGDNVARVTGWTCHAAEERLLGRSGSIAVKRQHLAHRFNQVIGRRRPSQPRVAIDSLTPLNCFRCQFVRQHDDTNICVLMLRLELPTHVPTGHVRKSEIDYGADWTKGRGECQCFGSSPSRLDDEAMSQ
jgi:hypothetical protein